jgi:outer membrane protein OmpA-like peptidoglycan-associated protein
MRPPAPARLVALLALGGLAAGCGLVKPYDVTGPTTLATTAPPTPTADTLGSLPPQSHDTVDVQLPAYLCKPIKVGDTTFASGSAELAGGTADLDRAADHIIELRDRDVAATLSITGYTDNVPTSYPGGNLGLSSARARAVFDYLVHVKGVEPAWMLPPNGLGEARPVASNDTPAGRALNRRVEIVFSCPKT